MKIRYKITILFTVLVTAILLVLSVAVYYFASLDRDKAFEQRLRSRAANMGQLYSLFADSMGLLSRIDESEVSQLSQKSIGIYDYLDLPVYRYDAPDADPIEITKKTLEQARVRGETFFLQHSRDYIAYHYTDELSRVVIIVAAYDSDGWKKLYQLRKILIVCLIVGVVVTVISGFLFSRQLVKPIQRIIEEVDEISTHNLSHRLQVGRGQDELNRLAATFNDLLNRMQESFIIQRRFISNASHELSTPLTSVSSQLEVTLQKNRSIPEYQEVLKSIQEDVTQMRQLTKSLLEIAKTGSQGSIELNEIRIDEVLFKVTADVQKLKEVYQVNFHFDDFPDDEKFLMVFGNNDLLYSALRNIVENGCKYSPDNTSAINLSFQEKKIIIAVKNQGDVIAEEEIANIFQPFYRAKSTGSAGGFGLGLALARRIIGLHKGSIQVKSSLADGTIFIIELPTILGFKN